MSTDPKSPGTTQPAASARHRGVRIFTYPKIIFVVPTLITSLVCGIGMLVIGDRTEDPTKRPVPAAALATKVETKTEVGKGAATEKTTTTTSTPPVRRFGSTQNFLAVSFLIVFAINLLIMSVDFPRFTVIALVAAFAAVGFFILWVNVYFELLKPLVLLLENIFLVANAGFYFAIALVITINFVIIWATRYLDYWEILPNEILHNHGPFSDLERYPTTNLKFDKEIPDILEYALLRSGRLVLHMPSQSKAIVLDNVLWINTKEEELKKLLSRMEVRITTDQETGSAPM